MKQTLNLKQSQQLTLSPQLQQAIRLLQLSSLELNEEVERMLEDNPLLEKEDGENDEDAVGTVTSLNEHEQTTPAAADVSEESDVRDAFETTSSLENEDFIVSSDEGGMSAGDEDYTAQYASGETLRDHLLNQLALTPVAPNEREVVQALIDELDEDGQLTTDRDVFYQTVGRAWTNDPTIFDRGLAILQSFDPSGVGARDLSECLALQIRALSSDDAPADIRQAAETIVTDYLDALAKQALPTMRRALGVDTDTVCAAIQLIRGLNPHPCNAFDGDQATHIVPDTIVYKDKGVWQVRLNEAVIPKIRINAFYSQWLGTGKTENDTRQSSYLQEARWLIRNIRQRFDTILRVSQVIVARQQRFFDHGQIAMQPMILRDVAEKLELHESTISRVTTNKYMLTPQGVFELKYFFGSHVATTAGGVASSTAIRALIKQIVNEESPKSPFSDQQISEMLAKEGIMAARRTVAKYRESMGIPPAHQRKDRL
jgi:RNA polymerase sigma-54 factor